MGILEFSASFRGSKATEARNSRLGNSRIPYYVILGLDPRISIRNSRILYDEIPRSSRGMTQDLKILDFLGVRGCLFFFFWEF